jgi:cytochrome c2
MCIVQQSPPLTEETLRISVAYSIAALDEKSWNEVVGPEKFYAQTQHLRIIEESCKDGVHPVYILVMDAEEAVAAIYFQVIDFHFSNALRNFQSAGIGWRKKALFQFLRLFSNTTIPLLQTGNLFFTGDNGIYIRPDYPEDTKLAILNKVMQDEGWRESLDRPIKATMFSNLCDSTRLDGLEELKFHDLETEPDLWMQVPDSLQDMSDYLGALSSKYRVRANKVFEKSGALRLNTLTAEEVSNQEQVLMQLYRNVADHATFNMTYLGAGYFPALKALYGDSVIIRTYELEGKAVGFSSGFVIEGVYHLHFIGMDYPTNELMPLYHRMLFEFVRDALEHRCYKIHFGRTATEIKTTIGAVPEPMHAFLKMESGFINCQLPRLLRNFGATPYVQRHPFRA